MSELLSAENATTYETEFKADEPKRFNSETFGNDQEIKDPSWGDALRDLVSAHAHEIVRCPWMGGAEVPLSVAMTTYGYPPNMTAEDIPSVIAVVWELLTYQVEETEETEEEDELEEEFAKTEDKPLKIEETIKKNDVKTQAQKAQKIIDKADSPIQTDNKIEAAKHLQLPAVVKNKAAKPAALAVPSNKFEVPERESVISKSSQESSAIKPAVEARQQIPALEISAAGAAVNSIAEAQSAPDRSQAAADSNIEPLVLPSAIGAGAPESKEILDLESLPISGDLMEEIDEKIEVAEDKSVLAELGSQTSINQLINLSEDELMLVPFGEVGMIPGELYELSDAVALGIEDQVMFPGLSNEPNLSEQIEITSPEQVVQNSLAIEEIEDSLTRLVEQIEASKPDKAELVNEILDKIIEVPARLKVEADENLVIETPAQQELEELFAELFDAMDIDYTPELVESLSYLTLRWQLTDKIEKLKVKEEIDEVQASSGTHEIIKKILVGLATIRKALANACTIGRSALQLYSSSPVAG